MADDKNSAGAAMPTLEDWQHWTLVMGRAQQMLMEFWAEQMKQVTLNPSSGQLSETVEYVRPEDEMEYAYEIAWRLRDGRCHS